MGPAAIDHSSGTIFTLFITEFADCGHKHKRIANRRKFNKTSVYETNERNLSPDVYFLRRNCSSDHLRSITSNRLKN